MITTELRDEMEMHLRRYKAARKAYKAAIAIETMSACLPQTESPAILQSV